MLSAALLAALLLAAPQDPVQVEATLSANRIAVGETTVLTLLVVTGGAAIDNMRSPSLPQGLQVLGTSDFSETRMGIPGRRARSLRREIIIAPSAGGTYEIPAAVAIVGGTAYRTQPLSLTVTGPSVGIGGETEGAAGETSLRVRLVPDTVYVGQQLIMHAEVTFAEQLRTRQTRPPAFEPPTPSGFWVQDLPDPVTVALRVRGGRSVESQTFRRAYFPLNAGTLTFPAAHLHYEVRRGFLNPPESRRVSSDPVDVIVLPLPQRDRPAAFTGAVGRLEMSASLSPERVPVGEAAVLTVELRGSGNVRALPEPRLPELRGVELYPPTQESTVDVAADVVGGSKRFRWVLVPESPGVVTIPPLEYGVFDPELRRYVTLQTDTLRMHAVPAVLASASDTMLRPLRTSRGQVPAAWARTPLFAALQVLPLLLVGAGTLARRRRARPPGPRQHARRVRAQLAALHGRNDDAVLPELEALLADAVVSILETPGVAPEPALRTRNRHAEADTYAALVADIRRARYAPPQERGSAQPLLARAESLVAALEPRGRASAPVGVVLAIVAPAALLSARSHGDESAFDAGVAAYAQAEHAAAAAHFQRYVRAQPDDPHGWHNLGLAAYHAGDPGRGVWAWLRGLRVAPRDAGLRHNLGLTARPETVRDVLPPDRLAAGERMALGAVAWWLLVLAAGFHASRRAAGGRVLAGAAVLALLVLSAGHFRSAVSPAIVTPLSTGTQLYAGPSVREVPLARFDVGDAARVVERRDDWLRVRHAAGTEAWVERAAVAGL